jgi:hypothetical protein
VLRPNSLETVGHASGMAPRVLVAALALALLVPALSARAAPSAGPSLRVVTLRPFTVRGLNFKPREFVRVTAIATMRSVRTVRATRLGTFRVDFGSVLIDPCAGFRAVAQGNRGSRASVVRDELPECPHPSGRWTRRVSLSVASHTSALRWCGLRRFALLEHAVLPQRGTALAISTGPDTAVDRRARRRHDGAPRSPVGADRPC